MISKQHHTAHGPDDRRSWVPRFNPAFVVALLAMTWGCSDRAPTSTDLSSTDAGSYFSARSEGGGHASGPNIVIELVGTAEGETRTVDGVEMDCFDLDVIDPRTGRVIGEGTDCLDLGSIVGDPTTGPFAINNTQFFHLKGGFVKSRLRTTISPVVDFSSLGLTHITGDVPGGTILEGTGRFRRLEGGLARLSGAVDMSEFFSNNTITFNCIFVLSSS